MVYGQLILLPTRTGSTRTFSLVNSYFFATRTLVNSYFFFGQLVLFFGQLVLFLWSSRTFGEKILTICFVLRACGLITGLGPVTNPSSQYED